MVFILKDTYDETQPKFKWDEIAFMWLFAVQDIRHCALTQHHWERRRLCTLYRAESCFRRDCWEVNQNGTVQNKGMRKTGAQQDYRNVNFA